MSYALHKEIIKGSSINYIIHGNFVSGNKINLLNIDEVLCHQILLVKNQIFEIFEIYRNKISNYPLYRYRLISEYKVFGEITSVEKTKLHDKPLDIIILSINYAKIAFLEYDSNLADFKILCLYNLENENLSNGKKFYSDSIQLIASETYNMIFFLTNDNNITILQKLNENNHNELLSEDEQIKYLDTIKGESFFQPSFYINFKEYGVMKIIKFYISNKDNEILDYFGSIKMINDEYVILLLLYKEGIVENQESESNQLNFFRTKVNLAIIYISKKKNNIRKFEILCENLDENSFDMFCLTNAKLIVILSPYLIQYVNFENKKCTKIILNTLYLPIMNILKAENLVDNSKTDLNYVGYNIDLRGGGYLALSSTQWIFTTSKGVLYAFSYINDYMNYKIDQIILQEKDEAVNSLNSPYKFITMPHPGIFFLSSYYADAVFISYHLNFYLIFNRMLNVSPIINFNSFLDRLHTKFIITSGYDKNSYLNFLYDKLYHDVIYQTECEEVSYLKSIKFTSSYSSYLIAGLTKGKTLIYDISGKSFDNVTERISLHPEKIISASVIKKELIMLVYETLIQFLDSSLNLVKNLQLITIDDKVKQVKGKDILVISTYNDRMYICKFYQNSLNLKDENDGDYLTNTIMIKHSEITDMFSKCKVLSYSVNQNEIDSKFYLIAYRENNSIEIYDITCDIQLVFRNEIISELPVIISNRSKTDIEKCSSDITYNIIINNSSSITNNIVPEEIFFDLLETKIVCSIIFKNGTIVYYDVIYVNDGNQFKMKKFYIDYIENIDYRDFFYNENSNLFIRFDNINDKAGVLLNLKNHQKILFEIDGRLKFIDMENNFLLRKSLGSFTDMSKEGCINGFVYYENGYIRLANIPKNYNITELGLIRRNQLSRFPVNCNVLTKTQGIINFYWYTMIEKELRPIGINNIYNNKFFYFMTLRTDEPIIIDQVEFPFNEMIIESKLVELYDITKIKNKYIAVGVNIIDERGEDQILYSKIQLYNINEGKYVKVFENNQHKGAISMIHSIDGVLVIGEGSRICLYQYIPLKEGLNKIAFVDNKNMITCSKIQSKFIITGDLYNSASWLVMNNTDITLNIYVLGKDSSQYSSTAIDFWIDDSEEPFKNGCIMADSDNLLHIFIINLENASNKLVETCNINLGKKLIELKYFSINNKSFNYYASIDGSVGIIRPISKDSHNKLSMLCEYMYNNLPFRGGVNPKQLFGNGFDMMYKKEQGNILDMELLNFFQLLPISLQKAMSKNIVLTRESIIQIINEIKNT